MDGSNDVYIYDEPFPAMHVLATIETDRDDLNEDCFCLYVLCRGWRIFLGCTHKILGFFAYVCQVTSLASYLYYASCAYASHNLWYRVWSILLVLHER
jgi:hypothetical protein